MSDYIKREDAIKSFVNAANQAGNIGDQIAFRMIISEIPTADVVEVVRCKDCKYMLQYEQIKACCNVNSFLQEPKCVSDNDFCSLGERSDA